MDSMRKQNGTTPEDEPTRSESVQHAPGEKLWRAITYSSRKNEAAGPKWKWRSAVDMSDGERKVCAVKNNIT